MLLGQTSISSDKILISENLVELSVEKPLKYIAINKFQISEFEAVRNSQNRTNPTDWQHVWRQKWRKLLRGESILLLFCQRLENAEKLNFSSELKKKWNFLWKAEFFFPWKLKKAEDTHPCIHYLTCNTLMKVSRENKLNVKTGKLSFGIVRQTFYSVLQ